MNESTDTLALTEFLLARIADDEAVAKAAAAVRGWEPEWLATEEEFGTFHVGARAVPVREWQYLLDEEAEHIALHDPARVLADCEAKRRIVSHMQIVAGIVGPRGEDARAVLTWLALPYADHPDFRRKWRPSVPPIPPPNPHLAATVDGEPPCPL